MAHLVAVARAMAREKLSNVPIKTESNVVRTQSSLP